MKILIVEDNYEKIELIHDSFSGENKPIIESVISVCDAVKKLECEVYELLIVDIQIPDVNGGGINERGGVDLLNHLECNQDLNIPLYVMGVSNYDKEELKTEFLSYGWPLFQTNRDKDEWLNLLRSKARAISDNVHSIKADIAIVTALEHTELQAVLNLDCNWKSISISGFNYHLGEIAVESGQVLSVVAVAADRMGVASASEVTARISSTFKPKFMIMTGICAGIKGKVDLGDLVVADFSWDWGAGKFDEDEDGKVKFLPDPHQIPLDNKYRKIVKTYAVSCHFMNDIYMAWEGKRGSDAPKVHLAPMACGSQVLANSSKVDEILGVTRKLLAIEMESYGFLNVCSSHEIYAMVSKAVCDFADRDKNDGAQEYAAHVSAMFAYNFIKENYEKII